MLKFSCPKCGAGMDKLKYYWSEDLSCGFIGFTYNEDNEPTLAKDPSVEREEVPDSRELYCMGCGEVLAESLSELDIARFITDQIKEE